MFKKVPPADQRMTTVIDISIPLSVLAIHAQFQTGSDHGIGECLLKNTDRGH
jgi:hypothetical protein